MKKVFNMENLVAGSKAYVDCFTGLIACRVLAIDHTGVNVEITARKARAYRRGECLWGISSSRVVPRASVHMRNGRKMIRRYAVDGVPKI